MDDFAILTNRRRAIVALVHSIVFLLIAFRQLFTAAPSAGIWDPLRVAAGTWILCAVFFLVSSILWYLFLLSQGWTEKLYFGLCALSASSGLLRTVFGDASFHAGLYIRVVLLGSAVLVGGMIVGIHSDRARTDS